MRKTRILTEIALMRAALWRVVRRIGNTCALGHPPFRGTIMGFPLGRLFRLTMFAGLGHR